MHAGDRIDLRELITHHWAWLLLGLPLSSLAQSTTNAVAAPSPNAYPSTFTIQTLRLYWSNERLQRLMRLQSAEQLQQEPIVGALNHALVQDRNDALAHGLLAYIYLQRATVARYQRSFEDMAICAGYARKHYAAVANLPPLSEAWLDAHASDSAILMTSLGLDTAAQTAERLRTGQLPVVLRDQSFTGWTWERRAVV